MGMLDQTGKIDWRETERQLAKRFAGPLALNAPMADYTSWRVGGPAALMFWPKDPADCAGAISYCLEKGIPALPLGSGTNLLVADAGVDALVVNMSGLKELSWDGPRVRAGAGVPLARLAAQAGQRDLGGLEFAIGIPGSVGGAVLMNAGAYGCQMADVVVSAEVLGPDGRLAILDAGELGYRYRESRLREGGWLVLAAEMELKPGDGEAIRAAMKDYLESRREKQPLELPNGGSVFKNPTGGGAGRFIDQAGLKGLTIGGAQVSPKHANFIVNMGNARAADIRALIEKVQATVLERYGVALEREVIYWGF